ncbi:MAG: ABC transporter substrate-binding protein [Alphaproteobacteria bacterium]|nr:ABC transporter substrate-binding protein [Alphaproteobacteria bacterium]
MITRRFAFAALTVWAMALWCAPASATATPNGESAASAFIESLAQEAVQALTVKDVTFDDRLKRFRQLFAANFDVPIIGKWVLGRYWNKASDAEKDEYFKLFEEYVAITYVNRFDQYSGESIKVVKTVSETGSDTIVYSEIHRPTGGEPIRVDWRVRSESDVYKIIDVYVQGISMSQTQRKEFASVIRNNGGEVKGLIDEMRKQIAKLSAVN